MSFFRKFIFFNLVFLLSVPCDSQDNGFSQNDADNQKVLPFFEITADFFDEFLPGKRVQKNKENFPDPLIDQTKQPTEIKAYFASSCSHCGHFFKDKENGLLSVVNQLIKPGYIRFWFRPLVLHPADLTIIRLCVNYDERAGGMYAGFEKKFTVFIQNQDRWMGFFQTQDYKTEEDKLTFKDRFLREQAEKWGIQIEDENNNLTGSDRDVLSIDAHNPNASLILFARGVLMLSQEQIRRALDPSEDDKFAKLAFDTQNQAKKNQTQPIDAVPAFFVNGQFKGSVSYADLERIAKK